VPHADIAAQRVLAEVLREIAELAHVSADSNLAITNGSYAGRVITAVFKPP
jgi:hypothetical protein